MFNREIFAAAFAASIELLIASEKVTKQELKVLSRQLLEATHETGDIQFVNRLLGVLTPVNRKVCVVFFKHFTGFSYDDKLAMFTKKSKKRYADAFAHYTEFMADPLNNLWTWAERNIEVEQKPFAVDKVTDYIKHALKNAAGAGLSQADVMRAVIKGGITADAIIACMDELGYDVKTDGSENPADNKPEDAHF